MCDVLANILIICLPWCHISSSRRAPVAPLAPPLERRAPAINICRRDGTDPSAMPSGIVTKECFIVQTIGAGGGERRHVPGRVERWAGARCPRAAFTGRVAIHQASGQSFDERAARQTVNQER